MGAIGNKDNNGNFHFFTGVSISEGLQVDLLWENPDTPTSSGFSSQTITVPNMDDYKFIYIIIFGDNQPPFTAEGYCLIRNEVNTAATTYAGYYAALSRAFTITSSTTILASRGYYQSSENNGAIIPYRIYGIK